MLRRIIILLVCFFNFAIACVAQDDPSQNLYFVRKGKEAAFREKDYLPGRGKAFYIYRNCIYDVVLHRNRWMPIRVVDIRQDSIYYTRHIGGSGTGEDYQHLDTLALHPRQLRKMRLLNERFFTLYSHYSLGSYRPVFVKGDSLKSFSYKTDTSYNNDSSRSIIHEVVPYLARKGAITVIEQRGIMYHYGGGIVPRFNEDITKNKKPLKPRKWVWFTPTNVNKISGLNLGVQTWSLADNDSLCIRGVNINADVLSAFGIVYAIAGVTRSVNPEFRDSVDKFRMASEVTGLSISGGGLIGDMHVKGFSINGGVSGVTEMGGLHITGLFNVSEEFKGVVISGLANQSIRGRGVQIGLINRCKNLKGIQLGLWNVNGRRSLPFINWSF